jgi:predicted signal transduction protein with EAL and GGDEF domain
MPKRSFFGNDFPRVTHVVLGALIGTNALFNSFSQPVWVALNVLVIVPSFGLALANAVGLVLRRHRRKHTVSQTPDQ